MTALDGESTGQEADMITVTCLAKAVGVTIVAFVAAVVLMVPFVQAGVSLVVLSSFWAVGMGVFAGLFAREYLESEHTWLWVASGFFLGVLVLPGLVFAYEWDQVQQRERFLAGADRFAGRPELGSTYDLAGGYAGRSRERAGW
jgi:hypothetical protein